MLFDEYPDRNGTTPYVCERNVPLIEVAKLLFFFKTSKLQPKNIISPLTPNTSLGAKQRFAHRRS